MKSNASVAELNTTKCPKCGNPNGGEAQDCGKCGARLHVQCRKCGSRNPRVENRCSKCGHRLYRSHRSSHHDHLDSDSKFKLLLVVVVLVALYVVVRWLAAPAGFPALSPAEPSR
jgi:ribosomal protein L40E